MKQIILLMLLTVVLVGCDGELTQNRSTYTKVIKESLVDPCSYKKYDEIVKKDGASMIITLDYGYKDKKGVAHRDKIIIEFIGTTILEIDGDTPETFKSRQKLEDIFDTLSR